MLALSGFATWTNVDGGSPKALLRLSTDSVVDASDRQHDAYLFRGGPVSPNYEWVVTFERFRADVEAARTSGKFIVLPNHFEYLARTATSSNSFRVERRSGSCFERRPMPTIFSRPNAATTTV